VTTTDYAYAKHFFMKNPIRKSELTHYKGLGKRKPHGIEKKIWNRAFVWAKKNKQLVIDKRGE